MLPPDPTGDIGPNHYVQMVNLSYAIYDRNANVLLAPADLKTRGYNSTGWPCDVIGVLRKAWGQ